MAFAGLRGTGNYSDGERPTNFRQTILWLDPNGRTPLQGLLSKVKKEVTNSAQINWFEEELNLRRFNLDGAVVGGSGTLVIDGPVPPEGATKIGADIAVGDVIKLEVDAAVYPGTTVEFMRVTAVQLNTPASHTTLTVARGEAGTSTIDPVADNSVLHVIADAQTEGSNVPGTHSKNPTKYENFTQIFRTPYEVTGTAQAEAGSIRTGDPLANDRKRKMFLHSEKLENTMLWGIPSEDLSGAKPRRYMGGLRQFITSNVKVYSADPTEADFLDFIAGVFDFTAPGAGDERFVLCGNGWLNTLNQLASGGLGTNVASRLRYEGKQVVYGMNLQMFTTPQGTFGVKTHPLLNIHPVYTYSAFIFAAPGIIYRPLTGRDTKINKGPQGKGIQANDADTIMHEWFTECTLEFHHEKTMAYIGGFKKWS